MARRTRTPVLATIAAFSARHWHLVLAAWLCILVGGAVAYRDGLAKEGFPAVNIAYVSVSGTYFVDDAAVVDAQLVGPLTAAFGSSPVVKRIVSRSSANGFVMFVDFPTTVTSLDGLAAIEALTPALPAGASLEFAPYDGTKYLNRYDLVVAVASEGTASSGTSGEATGDLVGLQAEAEVVASALSSDRGIGAAAVIPSLRTGLGSSSGAEETRQTSFSRVATGPERGFDDAVLIGVNAAEGVDAVQLRDRVETGLATLEMPAGTSTLVAASLADGIENQLAGLEGNLATGLVAVVLVCLALIGWRVAIVIAICMVTTLAASLVGLWAMGYSLNTVTLFALILTLGLLVDDAIVVSEAIDATRPKAGERRSVIEIVRAAVASVGRASLAGTLTTVLVFCPMLFVSGVLGQFIRVMPITVIVVLLVSFVVSITLVAALASVFVLSGSRPRTSARAPLPRLGTALGHLPVRAGEPTAGGVVLMVGAVLGSIVATVGGIHLLGTLDFNVFPPSKDTNSLQIDLSFEGLDSAADAAAATAPVDAIVQDVLGPMMRRAVYVGGSPRGATLLVDLVPAADRTTRSPVLVDELEARLGAISGLRASVFQVDPAPPPSSYPFAVQIDAEGDPAAAEALASELVATLPGQVLVRPSGQQALILDAVESTEGVIARDDGRHYVEVRASFDGDDTSGLLELAQQRTEELYPRAPLTFDFGQETENTEGFDSAVRALWIALGAMFVLLALQFRSLVQPLLILLAIPFSLIGVAVGLRLTGSSLSFFVMIGLIGLIGIVVNNTILLVDAANQLRGSGASPVQAIAGAMTRRFRPLLATTLTTVVGLAPLAILDPFWEPLAITIMGGLIASTVLVVVSFPFYYVVLETARDRLWRRPAQASMSTTVTDRVPPGA